MIEMDMLSHFSRVPIFLLHLMSFILRSCEQLQMDKITLCRGDKLEGNAQTKNAATENCTWNKKLYRN